MTRFRAVLLDRDGTLNVKAAEGHYITRPDEVHLLPGAAEAVGRLSRAGLSIAVVSNQRCVARGLATAADVDLTNARVGELLAPGGGRIDAWYVCPHDDGQCDCRKPLPGLVVRALAGFPDVQAPDAVMIGDAESDVRAGRAAAVTTIRLAPPDTRTEADLLVHDLAAAVSWVLAES